MMGDYLGPQWYALVGQEVVGPFGTVDEWYLFHAGPDWRHAHHAATGIDPWRVGYDELPNGQTVSTVFLGLDYRMFGEGPPLVFETLVLPDGEVCERCSTWAQAEEQHRSMVALGELLSEVPEN